MFKFLTKFNIISLLLPLVKSYYVNNVDLVPAPLYYQDIVFHVANGIPAKLGTIPCQVSIKIRMRQKYVNICGGFVIAENKIVSAAHCFEEKGNYCQRVCRKAQKRSLEGLYAVVGTLRNVGQYKADGSSPEQWRNLTKVFFPRGYWFPEHDISIAFTDKGFVFNKNVRPIPLASRRMDYGSMECVASGYGKISKYKFSEVLLWANLKLIPMSRCSEIHRQRMDNFICTESDNTNVLYGDSGGPLVCQNTGDPNDKGEGVIVGIVCGSRWFQDSPEEHTIFTRMTSYQHFASGNDATINLPVLNIVWILLIISRYC